MKFLKKGLQSAIEGLGYSFRRRTRTQDIEQLLETLYPKNSGIELIRLGGDNDGGYLIPDDLDGVSACFSPGVDATSAFELDCSKRGMALYLSDASVASVGPELRGTNYSFEQKFIGVSNDPLYQSMDEWVASSEAPGGDLILQMDIEGAEYESLINCSSQLLDRFRVICIELHHIGEWRNPRYFEFVEKGLSRLTKNHDCVHTHPNNSASLFSFDGIELPNVMELTFLRKDRMKGEGFVHTFPHSLDADCVAGKPSMALPRSWFASS